MTKSILSRMFFRRPSNAGRPSEKCMKQGVRPYFYRMNKIARK